MTLITILIKTKYQTHCKKHLNTLKFKTKIHKKTAHLNIYVMFS